MHPQVEVIYPSPRFWHTDLVLVNFNEAKEIHGHFSLSDGHY